MQCPCSKPKQAGPTGNQFTLPFNVEYGNNNPGGANQTVCNTNMCLLPGGPIIPTRPIFPSSLPSEFRPSSTNVDTNYLNVKKIGCICNLRTNSLTVDSGNSENPTNIQFRNLPVGNTTGNYASLLIDDNGNLVRSSVQKYSNYSNPKVFRPPVYQVPYQNQYQYGYRCHNDCNSEDCHVDPDCSETDMY